MCDERVSMCLPVCIGVHVCAPARVTCAALQAEEEVEEEEEEERGGRELHSPANSLGPPEWRQMKNDILNSMHQANTTRRRRKEIKMNLPSRGPD